MFFPGNVPTSWLMSNALPLIVLETSLPVLAEGIRSPSHKHTLLGPELHLKQQADTDTLGYRHCTSM